MNIILPLKMTFENSKQHYVYLNGHVASMFNPFNIVNLFRYPLSFLSTLMSVGISQIHAYDFIKIEENREKDKLKFKIFRDKNDYIKKNVELIYKPELSLIHGDSVVAVSDGEVVLVLDVFKDSLTIIQNLIINMTPPAFFVNNLIAAGNFVLIKHNPTTYSFYAHLHNNSIKVKRGDNVKSGDVIAQVGNTGNTMISHLHFGIVTLPSPIPILNISKRAVFKNFKASPFTGTTRIHALKIASGVASYETLLGKIQKIEYSSFTHSDLPGLYGLVKE